MSYKVIHAFTDLQDGNHVYLVGDKFPYNNKKATAERIAELSGNENKIGEPLIENVDDDFSQYMNPPVKDKNELPFVTLPQGTEYTKTEINRMPISELKVLAGGKGIENVEEMTGAELKKVLIEKLGL